MHTEAQQTRLHSSLHKMISKDLFEQRPSKRECTLESQHGPRLHCIHSVGCVMRQNLPNPTLPWELHSAFVDHFFIVQILSYVSSIQSREPGKLTGDEVGEWVDMLMHCQDPARPLWHFQAPFLWLLVSVSWSLQPLCPTGLRAGNVAGKGTLLPRPETWTPV